MGFQRVKFKIGGLETEEFEILRFPECLIKFSESGIVRAMKMVKWGLL